MEQIKSNFAGKTIFVGLDVHKKLAVLRRVKLKERTKIVAGLAEFLTSTIMTATQFSASLFG